MKEAESGGGGGEISRREKKPLTDACTHHIEQQQQQHIDGKHTSTLAIRQPLSRPLSLSLTDVPQLRSYRQSHQLDPPICWQNI
jgi:hypothetical protein